MCERGGRAATRGRGPPGGRGGYGECGGGRYSDHGSDRGGRFGDQGGGQYGGRGGGRGEDRGRGRGRGRGRDDFGGSFSMSRTMPDRPAEEGSAARPARRTLLQTLPQAEHDIAEQLEKLPAEIKRLGEAPRALRQGHGSRGRPVTIIANHFQVTCNLKQAAHYDVMIENVRRPPPGQESAPLPAREGAQKPLPIEVRRAVIRALAQAETWPIGWAFDGKNIFAPNTFLPPHEHSREVMAEDPERHRPRSFRVTTKWVANVNTSALFDFIRGNTKVVPQVAIQALDIALKHSVHMHPTAIPLARAVFFPDPSTTHNLSGGAEAWLGYQQSLRPCETGLTLNVDIACTAFLQELPIPKFLAQSANLMDERQLSGLNDMALKKATKAITGLKVQVIHLGQQKRTFSVKGLTRDGADRLMFINEQENREMSVQEYFETRYRMRLQLPGAPCLNVGNPRCPTYLPIEVCKIAKGQRRLKLDERQTAEMITLAAKKPSERHFVIEDSINKKAQLPRDPTVAAWQMTVAPQLTKVRARVLEPPPVLYQSQIIPDQNGTWNLRNARFYKPQKLESFGIVSFAPEHRVGHPGDPKGLPAFMRELIAMCERCGMAAPSNRDLPPICFHEGGQSYPGETLHQAYVAGQKHFGKDPGILFVLLPDMGTDLYKEVKRASDSFIGVPSQCFVAKKASIGVPSSRPRDQYCANLALKINAKLEGINQVVNGTRFQSWQQRPFIVIGADVTHNRTWMESEPSIAALVGSLDQHAARYASFVQLQGHSIEIIQGLQNAVRRLLIAFYQSTNKKKPERIIFFRDGISEGQFAKVQAEELPQIIACCRDLGQNSGEEYAPPVTYIVCQKRHNTRLLPADPRAADRSGNVLPGTVVDSQITHPTENDFYLNSHGGLLGTSRPTHYHVLFDQNNFTSDQLQDFIYCQCYQFARCTRSVSKAPPAYYAHLAATRGRCMLTKWTSSSDMESSSGKVEFAPIHPNLNKKMFYM